MSNVDRGDEMPEDKEAAEKTAAEAAEKEATEKAAAEAAEKEAAEKAAEKKDDQGRDDKGRFTGKGIIPIERHEKVLSKERERAEKAEREAAELRAQLSQISRGADVKKLEGEIEELEKARAKALVDGDTEKAAEYARDIRLKERAIAIQESKTLTDKEKEQERQALRFDAAVTSLEKTYPQLNPEDEAFDEDLVEMVLTMQDSLVRRDRMNPADALVKAAEKVMAKIAVGKGEKEDERPDGKKALSDANKDTAQARKEKQVAANIETAQKQPASMKDAGKDSDKGGMSQKIDVNKLSEEEFAALPAATRSRLRGDEL